MAKENSKFDIFSKKISLIILILFLILNIADFLNIIDGDIDFFEKITSWYAIAYIFYSVSFTKISVGNRIKSYDLLFILTFCLFTIPKALSLYIKNLELDYSKYFLFEFLLKLIPTNTDAFLFITFLLGVVFTIILSIAILMNHNVERDSFIGSFNFKDEYFSYLFRKVMLIFFSLFFGLIIFNFFMEWFALVVDDIIFVIGLIYYSIYYIHKHTNFNTDFLNKISNTGQDFFGNLIKTFSDKKTFFIGVSFLLTLHLLVDIGVFLIPYLTGIQNEFYLYVLGPNTHLPFFISFDFLGSSLINFKNTIFFNDIIFLNGDLFLIITTFFIYLIFLFLIFSLMILPFFIFFKNIQKQKILFNKFFSIFFISSIIFFMFIGFFNGIKSPINIEPIDTHYEVKGVDITSRSIIEDLSMLYNDLLYSFLLFLFLFLIIYFKYGKYSFYFDKIIIILVLVFFIFYIFLFFSSTVAVEKNKISSIFFEPKIKSEVNYIYINSLNFSDNNSIKHVKNIYGNHYTFSFFNDSKGHSFAYVILDNIKNDTIYFNDRLKTYFIGGTYDPTNNKLLGKNIEFYYYYGKDVFIINDSNLVTNNLNLKENVQDYYANLIFSSESKSIENDNNINKNKNFIYLNTLFHLIRFILISIFYILGILGFFIFYFRKNIYEN